MYSPGLGVKPETETEIVFVDDAPAEPLSHSAPHNYFFLQGQISLDIFFSLSINES